MFNYIDDFIGAETGNRAWQSLDSLVRLLESLGVKEAEKKRVWPTHRVNCVGTIVDTEKMILEVLPGRKEELLVELQDWTVRERCSVKDIQRLVGKLQFICAVVRPGRLFMSRMLDQLRVAEHKKEVRISQEFRADIEWWIKYLPEFDQVGILWMLHIQEPDWVAASDACLVGMGAVCGTEFLKAEFPQEWKNKNIAYLELLAVIVMCKVWIDKFVGKSIVIKCNNEAVASVLNTGRARDRTLIKLMRELVYVAAGKFEFKGKHLSGKSNKLPDLLSRWHEGDRVRTQFRQLVQGLNFTEVDVAPENFSMWHKW